VFQVVASSGRNSVHWTTPYLFASDSHAVASVLLDCDGDWEQTKDITFKENLMQKDKESSNVRYFALMKQRLETLNKEELSMLVNNTVAVRRLLVLLAICKAHPFVFDFISEQVREGFYNQYEKITYANFNEFFNEKKYEHPELQRVTEQTVAKMRQVVFRILEQTELIEDADSGILRRPYLPEALERLIVKDDPKWLAIYLYSNNEISSLYDLYA
jgi:hypothetical protein